VRWPRDHAFTPARLSSSAARNAGKRRVRSRTSAERSTESRPDVTGDTRRAQHGDDGGCVEARLLEPVGGHHLEHRTRRAMQRPGDRLAQRPGRARPRAPTRAPETGRALDDRPATRRALAHGAAARRLLQVTGEHGEEPLEPSGAPRARRARHLRTLRDSRGVGPVHQKPSEQTGERGRDAPRRLAGSARPRMASGSGSETAIPSRLAAPCRDVTPRAATGTPRGPQRFRAARRHRRSRVQPAGRTPRREPRRAASRRRPEARG